MNLMRIITTIRMAFRALRRNKMRSVLTALGIIIGVGAVIAMVSIGNGAKALVEAQVASLGENIITVFPGNFTQAGGVRSGGGGGGSFTSLTPEDATTIRQQVLNVPGVSEYVTTRGQLLANGLNWNAQVYGVGPDYPYIRSWRIEEGNFFDEVDVQNLGKVAVIGKTIVDNLYPDVDPIGQSLRIGNVPFRIIGVMSVKGFNLNGQDQDDAVFIPYSSHMRRLSRRTSLTQVLVQAANADAISQVQADITTALMERRGGGEPDFTVQNQQEIAAARTAATETMTYLLGAIAAVSLVVGGIGIMNIMLVSVTERTREIGIRMALGAHGKDVLTQFLIEAITLSSLGGILGVAIGIGGAELMGSWKGWAVEPSKTAMVVAVLFSASVGVFFGFYPARKAARLDPIEALRYE
jgi:putative ABC transport system permease protein